MPVKGERIVTSERKPRKKRQPVATALAAVEQPKRRRWRQKLEASIPGPTARGWALAGRAVRGAVVSGGPMRGRSPKPVDQLADC